MPSSSMKFVFFPLSPCIILCGMSPVLNCLAASPLIVYAVFAGILMSSCTGFSLSFISILLHSRKNSAICPSLFSFKTMAVSNALPADRMITLDEIGLILLFLLYQYRYFLLILRESIKSLHISLLTVQEFAEACALGVSRFDSFSFRCCYPQCGDLSVGI